MLKTHWRRHGRVLPLMAGTLMLLAPVVATFAPARNLARGAEPDAGAPDPVAQQEATPTPTPTPTPSGHYEPDDIQITESEDDPDQYFTSPTTQNGAALGVDDSISAGNFGTVTGGGTYQKQVALNYTWNWVSDGGLAPEPYKFLYNFGYHGQASATRTGGATAATSGTGSLSVYNETLPGLSAGVNGTSNVPNNQYLFPMSDQRDGASTISTRVDMTLSGTIGLTAHQGEASGTLNQSATSSVNVVQ